MCCSWVLNDMCTLVIRWGVSPKLAGAAVQHELKSFVCLYISCASESTRESEKDAYSPSDILRKDHSIFLSPRFAMRESPFKFPSCRFRVAITVGAYLQFRSRVMRDVDEPEAHATRDGLSQILHLF